MLLRSEHARYVCGCMRGVSLGEGYGCFVAVDKSGMRCRACFVSVASVYVSGSVCVWGCEDEILYAHE